MNSPDGRGRPGEFTLIARYFAPLASEPGSFGLIDDAAIIRPRDGMDLVVTKDALVAGRHFFADDPADLVARKALRVNLSDLVAKGAEPAGFLLALGLGPDWSEDWAAGLADGFGEDIRMFGIPLLGGDTVGTDGPAFVSITAFGHVPRGHMVRRAGAEPGERLYVSGTIGDAALGLALRREPDLAREAGLAAGHADHLLARYLLPQPRPALAPVLRRHASAAMDLSDGLAGDLAKLTAASKVIARVDVPAVPLSPAASAMLDAMPGLIEAVLGGGDDYEILASVPVERAAEFESDAADAGMAVTAIGEAMAGQGPPMLRLGTGELMTLSRASFTHF